MTLLEFLVTRNIQFRRHSSKQDEIWVQCPVCQDGKFRLGINLRKNIGRCFNGGCDFRSKRATAALAFHFHVAEFRGDSVSAAPEKEYEPARLPEDFTRLYSRGDSLLRRARAYAEKRGITPTLAKRWRIGASFFGRYGYRIVFPVYYNDKHLVSLVARDFTGSQEPKYLMHSGKKYVWGLRPGAEVVLAEGIFKAIALESALSLPAGAMLGHSITDEMQEQLIAFGVRRAIIWPDPDIAGVTGILKVIPRLRECGIACYLPVKLPQLPADDASAEQITKDAYFDSADSLKAKYSSQIGQR